MASGSRGIIRSHWKVTGTRLSEGRLRQCISMCDITESEVRLLDSVEIPHSNSSPRWGPCLSALGTNRTVSPRSASQKGCSICHWQPAPGWSSADNQRIPAVHHTATVLGMGQGQRHNHISSSWQPPPPGNSYGNPNGNFPAFSPWGSSSGFCSLGKQGWNGLQPH